MFTLIHNFGVTKNSFIHDQSEQLERLDRFLFIYLFPPPTVTEFQVFLFHLFYFIFLGLSSPNCAGVGSCQ